MDQVQVEVVGPDPFERLSNGRFDMAVLGAPQLARDKDLVARDARVLDALADFRFVAVDPGEVKVPVAVLQRNLDRIGYFARLGLPCACTDGAFVKSATLD